MRSVNPSYRIESVGHRSARVCRFCALAFVVALPSFVFACTTQDGSPFNSPPATYATDGGSGGLEEDQPPPTANCPPLPRNGDSCVGFDSGTGTLVCGYLCSESGGEQASATCVDASTWVVDPPGGCGSSFVDASADASDAADE